MDNFLPEELDNLSFKKSNMLITAKYNSSLLENQIIAVALTRIELDPTNKDCPLQARLYPRELRKLISDDTNIYRELKKVAKTITGHSMLIEDGNGNFKAFSMVPNADYQDGVFIIKFNTELQQHIFVEKNYTNLELSIMTGFKKNASFRIYELLKKDVYKIQKITDSIQVEYRVSELKFMIGLANNNNDKIKEAMNKSRENIDWDFLYDKLPDNEKKYEDWKEFKRRILIPAQKELEESSDIRFEFEPIREGRFTKRIVFTIFKNIPQNQDIILKKKRMLDGDITGEQLEIPMIMHQDFYEEYVGHNELTKEDLDILLFKADGDENLLRNYIKMADSYKHINNYMGWLIKAIEDGYDSVEVIDGSSEKANNVRDVMEDIESNRTQIEENAWKKITTKDDFQDFLNELQVLDIDIQTLEIIYTPKELMNCYASWKLGKGIIL